MSYARQVIDAFIRATTRVKHVEDFFLLRDGTSCQGWILEADDENVYWRRDVEPWDCDEEDVVTPIDEIDLDSLSYWDDERKRGVKFRLDVPE